MSILSIILLLISLTEPAKTESCLVIEKRSITINGDTSLGGFSCGYEVSGVNDTLYMNNLPYSPYSFTIPVEAFKCGNFLLNRDFRATLKAEEYPKVTVQVQSLQEQGKGLLTGCIKLSLVGKYKTLDDVEFCQGFVNGKQTLTTSFVFHASEFKLKPPQKLGGLVTTSDKMNISVSLVLNNSTQKSPCLAN
ncbi:YceI family protein [Fulvivirga sp. 29W222]|uniref:YceI family protein n=1 Tax=Fulvivirga marina TaxID=2494733 RepID=A0A937FW20_9BACT|nr:YceI family protein [Fulvivirga marina]MBL6446032.1 YceI family protein [Fulvivirga marina]